MIIDYLANHRSYIEEVANLKYKQWHHTSPETPYSERFWEVDDSARVGKVPCTLIALDENGLLGFVSLHKFHFKANIHEGIWLLNLLVKEAHQRQGIGTALIDRCINETRALGYDTLYLWTESEALTRYYANRGWQLLGVDEDGDDVMAYNI